MPAHRKHPAKPSQQQQQQRNPPQDESPVRTRYGRGAKSAPASQGENVVPPKSSPNGTNGVVARGKATRSSSNVSTYSSIDVAAPETYAKLDSPTGFLIIHGLSSKFLADLREKEERRLRKEKTRRERRWRLHFGDMTLSDLEHDQSSDEDVDLSSPPRTAPARGRGSRGGRGGRGRGGRGRGGRGRGRGGSTTAADVSPVRTLVRKTRNAAPIYPDSDEDGEDSTNQESASDDAKDLPEIEDDDVAMAEAADDGEDEQEDEEMPLNAPVESNTPPGSPPPDIAAGLAPQTSKASLPVPKIVQPKRSASQTPRNGGTPSMTPTPKLLDPEDDVLTDSDLPDAWINDYIPPASEAECEDRADFLLKKRYKPMIDVHELIANLTKFAPSQRSSESLYRLAENTQMILKAWQDEYLMLDARTAPHSHPPKKPANGGRVPVADDVFEDLKEADLYGYNYDPKKPPGTQDPFAQRIGAEKSGGRELRQRRARDMLDSAAPSEEEEEEESEARGVGRRQRRATRRFEEVVTGNSTPKKNNGWGGKRVKGVSRFTQDASATPEPDGRAAKRQKVNHSSLLHQRIQEMREESAVTSSGDEASSQDPSEGSDEYRRRGRPAGSKNVARRSDYGVKKGPRKKPTEQAIPTTIAQPQNVAPAVLQSLSEGQNQFSIDPQPTLAGMSGSVSTPPIMPQPVSTVFQATPQPPGAHDPMAHAPPPAEPHPDAYMNTTPLSQYSHPYAEQSPDTSGSGKRGKPRVKSEKRSQSMTIWWAERKARQKELEEKSNPTGFKQETSKPSTPRPGGRRGGRTPSAGRPEQQPQQQPLPPPYPQHPEYRQQEAYPPLPPPQALSAPSPNIAYSQTAPSTHYPHQILMQPSPLAAIPSGPFPAPPSSGPPTSGPAHLQHSPPGPAGSQPPHMPAPRGSMPALAPAPMPPQPLSYPSPYGPRTAPRPKSSAPPPLAPAPAHVSPYPPPSSVGPVSHREIVEMPFKVLIPGPPPGGEPERR